MRNLGPVIESLWPSVLILQMRVIILPPFWGFVRFKWYCVYKALAAVFGTVSPSVNNRGYLLTWPSSSPWRPELCCLKLLIEKLNQTRDLCISEKVKGNSRVSSTLLCVRTRAGKQENVGDPKEPEEAHPRRSSLGCSGEYKRNIAHSVLWDFKMLFQNASHYKEILSQVTNPGGRLHVKLSALIPLAEVNVPEGKDLS